MSIRKIQLIWIFVSLFFCALGQTGKKSYPEADALYLNLTKTFTLNKDGSLINAVEKRQKLLTHRAFQSLYGETRVNYNPEFQQISIKKSFTENNQGEKIETPENGYNDILPGFSNNLKAFSHLREMVVTHTGLEVGAIINCNYELKTDPEKFPGLQGDEILPTDCPIEKLTIIVKIPAEQPLFYKMLNASVVPKVEHGKEYDSYTWKINDLPQYNREMLSVACNDQPRLLFSTIPDQSTAIRWFKNQEAFQASAGEAAKKYIDKKTTGDLTPVQKALKIQEIVVKELNTTPIPAALLAFRVRSPEQVWNSNAGTTFEKSCLLAALLQEKGYDAEVCLVIPECFKEEKMPLLLVGEPVVKLSTVQEGVLLLSAEKLNTNSFELCNNHQVIIGIRNTDNKTESSHTGGKIESIGQFTIDPEGRLKGEIIGIFSNRCNYFHDIVRNPDKVLNLFGEFSGKTVSISALQSKLNFSVDKKDAVTTRGNLRFLSIPESGAGMATLHLNPLPTNRISSLDLGSPVTETYNSSFVLPTGYQLVNSADITLKGTFGKLTIKIVQHENRVEVTRELEINKPAIAKEDYPEFREWINKWSTAKYRQIILKNE